MTSRDCQSQPPRLTTADIHYSCHPRPVQRPGSIDVNQLFHFRNQDIPFRLQPFKTLSTHIIRPAVQHDFISFLNPSYSGILIFLCSARNTHLNNFLYRANHTPHQTSILPFENLKDLQYIQQISDFKGISTLVNSAKIRSQRPRTASIFHGGDSRRCFDGQASPSRYFSNRMEIPNPCNHKYARFLMSAYWRSHALTRKWRIIFLSAYSYKSAIEVSKEEDIWKGVEAIQKGPEEQRHASRGSTAASFDSHRQGTIG